MVARRGPNANEIRSLFPRREDRAAWASWWHMWADVGRLAGRLDPEAALYEPTHVGDNSLPDVREGGRP
jgi:hypothetical protein